MGIGLKRFCSDRDKQTSPDRVKQRQFNDSMVGSVSFKECAGGALKRVPIEGKSIDNRIRG
jgi:hypothetical protein